MTVRLPSGHVSDTAIETATGHRRGSNEYRKITVAMFASGLATFTVLYCVQALFPAIAADFRLSPATVSLVLSVSTLTLAIGVIPLTTLSESLGRTRVMTASLVATAVLGVMVPFAPNLAVLLALRAVQGFALAGLQATAMAYLSEELHRESLGAGMGLYIAGNGIGGMLGRVLAGVVVDFASWRVAMGVVGLLAVACTAVFRLLILPSRRFEPKPLRIRPLIGSIGTALRDHGLLRLYLVGFLAMGAFVTVYNYLGFRLLRAPFELPHAVVSMLFVVYIAGSAASAAAGRLVDRFGRPPLLWSMAALTVLGIAALAWNTLALVVVGLVLVTAGFFATHAVASGWVGARAAVLRVPGPAIYLFCYYLGSSIGGTLGGIWFAKAGWPGVTGYLGIMFGLVIALGLSLLRLKPLRR